MGDFNRGLVRGLVEEGNIDLDSRVQKRNPDGSFSTIESITVSTDKGVFLIPTISPIGDRMDNETAFEFFKTTGSHLGRFNDIESADGYARVLSERQGQKFLE